MPPCDEQSRQAIGAFVADIRSLVSASCQSFHVSLDWLAIGSIATAVSAAVIAYQSVQTKRAADAAVDAQAVAQAALTVSQNTLALAERENQANEAGLRASRTVAFEAAKQRRDLRARLIDIDVIGDPSIHERPPSGASVPPFGGLVPIAQGNEYHLPRDADRYLFLRQELHLRSTDGNPIWIGPWGNLTIEGLARNADDLLLGAATVACQLYTRRTVAEWVRIAEEREQGQPGSHDKAGIRVMDAHDDGTIDQYELQVSGTPLKRVPNRQGVWVVDTGSDNGYPTIVTKLQPMLRRYWISKSRNEELLPE